MYNLYFVTYLWLARKMQKEREGEKLMELEGHTEGVNCLSISPGLKFFVALVRKRVLLFKYFSI